MIATYVIIANPTFFIKTTKKDNKAAIKINTKISKHIDKIKYFNISEVKSVIKLGNNSSVKAPDNNECTNITPTIVIAVEKNIDRNIFDLECPEIILFLIVPKLKSLAIIINNKIGTINPKSLVNENEPKNIASKEKNIEKMSSPPSPIKPENSILYNKGVIIEKTRPIIHVTKNSLSFTILFKSTFKRLIIIFTSY